MTQIKDCNELINHRLDVLEAIAGSYGETLSSIKVEVARLEERSAQVQSSLGSLDTKMDKILDKVESLATVETRVSSLENLTGYGKDAIGFLVKKLVPAIAAIGLATMGAAHATVALDWFKALMGS